MKTMDLHIHSSFSDGELSPEQIVVKAKEYGLSAIAITDHDTVDGIEEAMEAGKKYGVEVVPAIEFNVQHSEALHILAFYIDHNNRRLKFELSELVELRKERIKKFITNLQKQNLKVDYDELLEHSKAKVLGRPHLANYLVYKKYCLSLQDAYKKYIGKECPAYVPNIKLTINKIIDLINGAKGIPFLAHPVQMKNFDINYFIKSGIKGIEAYYYYQTEKDTLFFLEIANKYNLLVSGGSDSHGANAATDGFGKFSAPYFHLEKIKKYLNKG
ncbi:MAG TPA: PHP domain-containing protein [bacterium]|nr:PHP domain-containing protein [bacterium]HOL46657.1 PHP domain-containing protein [bacterium]HPQ17772.1 PHP domain-containing protein [bacterium]